jgi:hypothetical protein
MLLTVPVAAHNYRLALCALIESHAPGPTPVSAYIKKTPAEDGRGLF